MNMTPEELCARARRHQRNDGRAFGVFLALVVLAAAVAMRNLMRLHYSPIQNPWLGFAMLWTLLALGYFVWISVPRRGPQGAEGPCVQFLGRVLEGKRLWARFVRRGVLLLVPAVLAAWWGGGPAMAARNLGITSPLLLRLAEGPAPLVPIGFLMASIWVLMVLEERRLDGRIRQLEQ